MENSDEISKPLICYNESIHSDLRNLIEKTRCDLLSNNIFFPKDIKMSFYFLGSLAKKTALPFSDLEFGILVSKKTVAVKEYIQCFMKCFHQNLKKQNYHLDVNGWHPPYFRKKGLNGKEIFLSTSSEIKEFFKRGKNIRVRTSLLQTLFFYGDERLYKQSLQNQDKENFLPALLEEFAITKNHIEKNLKKIQMILQKKKELIKEDFNFKFYITKPIEELLFYLGQYYCISYEGSFDLIKKLYENQYISQKQKNEVTEALSFGIKKRLFSNDSNVKICILSENDLESIQSHIAIIFSFLGFVESSLCMRDS